MRVCGDDHAAAYKSCHFLPATRCIIFSQTVQSLLLVFHNSRDFFILDSAYSVDTESF